MSTIAEIERAIEKLSIEEVSLLAEWIQDYQATVFASGQVFSILDVEEDSWSAIAESLTDDKKGLRS